MTGIPDECCQVDHPHAVRHDRRPPGDRNLPLLAVAMHVGDHLLRCAAATEGRTTPVAGPAAGSVMPNAAASFSAISISRVAPTVSSPCRRRSNAEARRQRDNVAAGRCPIRRFPRTADRRCSIARSVSPIVSEATPSACSTEPKQVTPMLAIIGNARCGSRMSYASDETA